MVISRLEPEDVIATISGFSFFVFGSMLGPNF